MGLIHVVVGYYLLGAQVPISGKIIAVDDRLVQTTIRLNGYGSKEACARAKQENKDLYELRATGNADEPLILRFVKAAWCGKDEAVKP